MDKTKSVPESSSASRHEMIAKYVARTLSLAMEVKTKTPSGCRGKSASLKGFAQKFSIWGHVRPRCQMQWHFAINRHKYCATITFLSGITTKAFYSSHNYSWKVKNSCRRKILAWKSGSLFLPRMTTGTEHLLRWQPLTAYLLRKGKYCTTSPAGGQLWQWTGSTNIRVRADCLHKRLIYFPILRSCG